MKRTALTGALVLILAGCDMNASSRTSAGDFQSRAAEQALAEGDYAKALAAAELAASYDPLNPARRDLLLRTRLSVFVHAPDEVPGEKTAVWQHQAETMLSRDPQRAALYLSAQGSLSLPRDVEKAQKLFQDAVSRDGHFAPARVGLAQTLTQQGKRDEAIAELDKALEVTPKNGPALALLGRLQLEKNENEKGLATLEAAVKERADAQTYQHLAIAYWRNEKKEEAGQAILQAVNLAPQSPSARMEYANWLKETGKAEQAFEQYGKAEELGAGPSATFSRGLLLFHANNHAEAVKAFDGAVDAGMVSALYESGRTYEAGGDPQTAAQRYELFIQRRGQLPEEQERAKDAQSRLDRLRAPPPPPPSFMPPAGFDPGFGPPPGEGVPTP